MNINQLKEKLTLPPSEPLIFDIPDSIDGSKRKAYFINMEYFTADNTQNIESKITKKFLTIKFFVKCFLEREEVITSEETYDELNDEIIPGVPQNVIKIYELPERSFEDEFTADYKTFVNKFTGEILTKPKNDAADYSGLLNIIESKIANNEFTEQEFLNDQVPGFGVCNQIQFFEAMFHDEDNGGLIPVKDLISSFALTADWKDIKTKLIN